MIARGGDSSGFQRIFTAAFQAVGRVTLIMKPYLGGCGIQHTPGDTSGGRLGF